MILHPVFFCFVFLCFFFLGGGLFFLILYSFIFSAPMASYNSDNASFRHIKERILRQYDEVFNLLNNSGKLPASLREKVKKLHEKLIEKRKEFTEEFCQIVVSGKPSPF